MRQGRPRRFEERPDSPFGVALKELLRRQSGFTQTKLAVESMISAETLSRMIKGERLDGTNTRFHLRSIVRALYRQGLLSSVDEANILITKIPTVKELDERDKDDQELLEELNEPITLKKMLTLLNRQHENFTVNDHDIDVLKYNPQDRQKLSNTAWSLYVELTTRIAIQPLTPEHGLLREALNSLHTLFQETRKILREGGAQVATEGEESIGSLAIQFLNEKVRPFTTKWHPLLLAHEKMRSIEISEYEQQQQWGQAEEMRIELGKLQEELEFYAAFLAKIAGIKHKRVSRTQQD